MPPFPRLFAVVTASVLTLPAFATDKPASPDDLEPTLRQLEKDIAKVRGLAFKSPVKIEITEAETHGERFKKMRRTQN